MKKFNLDLISEFEDFDSSNFIAKFFKKGKLKAVSSGRKDYLKTLLTKGQIDELKENLLNGTYLKKMSQKVPKEVKDDLEEYVENAEGEYSLICHNYGKSSELVHYVAINKGNGKRDHIKLAFSKNDKPENETGETVEVTGHLLDGTLILGGKTSGKGKGGGGTPTPTPTPAPSGAKKIAFFLINFADVTCPFDPTSIKNVMFYNPDSVDKFYRETSFGQITMTGDVFGPYTISNLSTEACNFQSWSDAADVVINASGFNRTGYTNFVYCFPSTSCGIGYGNVGGNPTKAWLFRTNYVDLYAHELGHNLGMQHAGDAGNQYNDYSDVMGYSGIGLRQVNAPHKVERGWVPSSNVINLTTPSIATINTLHALEVSPSLGPQVITVNKTDTNEVYYVCFRAAIGFDAGLASGHVNKVNIYKKANTTGATQTYFIQALNDGEMFTDTVNKIRITAISHTADTASVKVEPV